MHPNQAQIPDETTLDQLDQLIATMLREVFLDTYQRRFGEPASADIEARIQAACSMELKDWIPNLIDAEHPEEIFTSPLEAALAGFASELLQRQFGPDLDASTTLKGLEERLQVYLETHPAQVGQ
jgi:hypothetical protein